MALLISVRSASASSAVARRLRIRSRRSPTSLLAWSFTTSLATSPKKPRRKSTTTRCEMLPPRHRRLVDLRPAPNGALSGAQSRSYRLCPTVRGDSRAVLCHQHCRSGARPRMACRPAQTLSPIPHHGRVLRYQREEAIIRLCDRPNVRANGLIQNARDAAGGPAVVAHAVPCAATRVRRCNIRVGLIVPSDFSRSQASRRIGACGARLEAAN